MTLTPWDLRVQLPREARDKNVVLPPYLQHPVLFGLRGEYQTFQSHHPETLAFSSSSLGSICAGLEVEEVRSSGKVTGGLPFHLQALAPSSPRRALEEALTLTRCLKSLVTKSRPSQANPQGTPDVLTRPLDARSDVRAFLGERSKVLHLSGLPHDTTQSELESWFTQYGGRPIAFWTLRTPEGGKPSGSGFVVFGSHEEVSHFFECDWWLEQVNGLRKYLVPRSSCFAALFSISFPHIRSLPLPMQLSVVENFVFSLCPVIQICHSSGLSRCKIHNSPPPIRVTDHPRTSR